MDIDGPLLLDDGAEPFPTSAARAADDQAAAGPASEHVGAVQAQRRAPRTRRAIPTDHTTQISNAQLGAWNRHYLANMATAAEQRTQRRVAAHAKSNAYFFVYGGGLTGPGAFNPAFARPNHPLAAFAGARLEALVAAAAGRRPPKRSLSPASVADSEAERQHARRRISDDQAAQVPRGSDPFMPMAAADEEALLAPLDDTIEHGRDKPSSLAEDFSTALPWNVASSRPSSFRAGSRALSIQQQQQLHQQRAAVLGATAFDRRASRLASASPLRGRGATARAPSSVGLPSPRGLPAGSLAGGDDDEALLGPLQGLTSTAAGDDGFALFEPEASGAQSEPERAALGRESANFLDFVRANAIAAPDAESGSEREGEDASDGEARVRFAELLPPERHARAVAAQGFAHVLALATRGLLRAWQDDEGEWGEVVLGVPWERVEELADVAAAA